MKGRGGGGGGGGRFGGGGGRGNSNAPSFRGGGGAGGRGAYSGPTLPFSLTREIGMDDPTSGGGGGGSKRRAERDDSQFDRRQQQKRSRAGQRSPSHDSADDRAFFNEDDSDALAPSPSPPPPSRKPSNSKAPRTKFEELLSSSGAGGGPGGGGDRLLASAGAAAAAAEASLQRRLVKQLGLRGKAKKRALEQPDGLFRSGEARAAKKEVSDVPERRRKKRASSDDEDEDEDSESDAPPLSDSDDDCFGLNAAVAGEEDESDEGEEAAGEGGEGFSSSDDENYESGGDESDSDESDSDAPLLSDSDDDCFGLNANLEDDDDSAEDDESSGEEEEEEEAEEERDGDADLLSSSSDDDDGGSSQGESSESEGDDEKARDISSTAAVMPPRTPHEGQYLPPAARAAAAAAAAAEARKKGGGNDSSNDVESAAVLRRVRGLLNRLAEANLRGVSGDVASLFASPGAASPALVREALCLELVSSCAKGPRASAAFASAAAALVAAVAANVKSQRLAAEFAASTSIALEEALRVKERKQKKGNDGGEEEGSDSVVDSTSVSSLVSLCCALHSVGVLRPAAMFSLLNVRFERFDRDADVAAAAAVLRLSGARLRSEDPAALKEAVLIAAEKAAEARKAGRLTARGEALLSLVLDVKNNRRGGGQEQQQGPGALSAATMRWLRSGAPSASSAPLSSSAAASAGEEHYALHGVTWETLVSPSKRGQWWLPSASAAAAKGKDKLLSAAAPPSSTRVRLAEDEDDDAENINGLETDDLLALAAAQRLGSTPSRRACFCAAMGAADAADGAERLLRLPLKGASARDVVRVPLSCALREASWNPYYSALLSRLARAKRSHRASLLLALRDELRDAAEGSGTGSGGGENNPRAAATLARLAGALVAGHVVPLSSLLPREGRRGGQAAEGDAASLSALCGLSAGSDALAALLPPRRIALWRSLLRHALAAAPDRASAASPFERMSAAALAAKRNGGRGGGGGRSSRGSDGDDDDLDGFAEARLEKRKRKDASASDAPGARVGPLAFPPLDASEACASLRSFIRRFVVPGLDGGASSSSGSSTMFGSVSLDELTLRARGAERALAAGAKAGQSVT